MGTFKVRDLLVTINPSGGECDGGFGGILTSPCHEASCFQHVTVCDPQVSACGGCGPSYPKPPPPPPPGAPSIDRPDIIENLTSAQLAVLKRQLKEKLAGFAKREKALKSEAAAVKQHLRNAAARVADRERALKVQAKKAGTTVEQLELDSLEKHLTGALASVRKRKATKGKKRRRK